MKQKKQPHKTGTNTPTAQAPDTSEDPSQAEDDRALGFLCQWYPAHFVHDGMRFNCTKQWMMWHKAISSDDQVTAKVIMATLSPLKQKQLDKEVVGFDEKLWDTRKSEVVEQGNYLKFTLCDDTPSIPKGSDWTPRPLRDLLLETYERELVEASHFDRVWGIGFSPEAAARTPRAQWGQNLLGKALMAVREKIRGEMEQAAAAAVEERSEV